MKKVRVWYERFGLLQIYDGWSAVTFFTINKDNQRQYFQIILARLGNKRGSVERLFKKTPSLHYFYERIGNVVKVAGSFEVDEKVLKGKLEMEIL